MFSRIVYTFLFFLLAFSVSAQEKWDLRKCVEYALQNNISIKQQDIQVKIDELTWRQSDLSKYPNLNLSSNLGVNTGRSIDRTTNLFTTQSIFYNSFSLQSNVEVFNWFSKKNTIAANKFSFQASQAAADKLRNDVALNVAAAYLQVLLANEQMNVSKVQIDQTTAQVNNTEKLVNAGTLPELNLVELQAQLAKDSTTYISAVGTHDQSLLLLKSLLNIDPANELEIVTPPVDLIPIDPIATLQPDIVYQSALANLPQQKISKLRLESAKKFAAAEKGYLYPAISFGASLSSNYSNSKYNPRLVSVTPVGVDTIGTVSGTNTPVVAPSYKTSYQYYANPYATQLSDNFSNGLGINISIPIFNGRSARTNWEKQKLTVRNLELQKELDSLSLKQDIYKAYSDAMTALQSFNSATSAVESAQKAFDIAEKRYDVGLLSTIDLITNQNNLFSAKINRLSAQYSYVFKMKVLEFYKGQGIKL